MIFVEKFLSSSNMYICSSIMTLKQSLPTYTLFSASNESQESVVFMSKFESVSGYEINAKNCIFI